MNPKQIWLTFDDGPHISNTAIALNTLDRHDIKATFFVLGNRVAKHGDMIKRILDRGHRIGNHTYDHIRLVGVSRAVIIEQIKKTEEALAPYQPADRIIRPPYGAHDTMVDRIIAELGYRQVLWNVDTEDWKRKPDGWVGYGIEQVKRKNRAIVLMHDIHASTAENLNIFINKIKELGEVRFEPPATLILPASGEERMYMVVRGDTLSKIAQEFYGDAHKSQLIFEANQAILSHPDRIYPGLVLHIPPVVASQKQ